jgi:hypothetical protein
MAKIIMQLNIPIPKDLSELTEQNFMAHHFWLKDARELGEYILSPFKKGVCARTGYSDSNRPGEKVVTPVSITDEIVFEVTTTSTTKNPAYSEVTANFGNYLAFLAGQYAEKIPRKGILTVNDEPFVSVDDLTAKLDELRENSLEGKEGVSQGIKLVKPEVLVEKAPEVCTIVFGRDYSALTEYNARLYVAVDLAVKQGNAAAKDFKKRVLNDSLQTVGVSADALSEVVTLAYPYEHWTFLHQMEPRNPTEHSKVVEALTKEWPQAIRSNSNIGDLTMVARMVDDKTRGILQSKGLADDKFMAEYRPTKRDGEMYVRLQGVSDRLKKYLVGLQKHTVEQNLAIYPTGRMQSESK